MRIILMLILCLSAMVASFAQAAEPPKAEAQMQLAIPGPAEGTKVTEAYVRMLARGAYFWGWPLADIYNRRLLFKELQEPALMGGVAPVAPLNRLAMLTDYIDPSERMVACPNQDVVYGAAVLALDLAPVVVQVPDFGQRFWVYQAVDLKTDSFAELGSMYASKPGFYLLVGPDWKGQAPKGVVKVFRSALTGRVRPFLRATGFRQRWSDNKTSCLWETRLAGSMLYLFSASFTDRYVTWLWSNSDCAMLVCLKQGYS